MMMPRLPDNGKKIRVGAASDPVQRLPAERKEGIEGGPQFLVVLVGLRDLLNQYLGEFRRPRLELPPPLARNYRSPVPCMRRIR
jgi:hypothetical protein